MNDHSPRTDARSARSGPASCSTTTAWARSSNCPTCRSWSWGWTTGRSSRALTEISEPRLLKAVQQELGPQVAKLLTPPVTADPAGAQASPFDDTANVGVPVAPFPRWQVCPYCRLLAPIQSGLFELRLDPYRKDKSRYVHRICKKKGKPPTVVPARFLVACEHGHLDDFPWVEFVHRGKTDCRYELRLYELGASGEVADIQVQCVRCDLKRRLSDAFSEEGRDRAGQSAGDGGPTCGSTTRTRARGSSGRSCSGPRIAGSRSCCRSCRSRRRPTSWASSSSGTGPTWRSASRPAR